MDEEELAELEAFVADVPEDPGPPAGVDPDDPFAWWDGLADENGDSVHG